MMRETMVIPSGYGETASQQFATSGKSFQLLLARLVRIGCLLVASVGAAVLCGWIFDIPQLTRLLPGLAFMKINTACALLFASVALWLLHTQQQSSPWVRVARCLAILMVTLGGLTLSEHLFGLELGIDQHIPSGTQLSAQSAHFRRL